MTSGIFSGDMTETMLVRTRNAASTAAACEVIIGEPSSVHLGASTAVARSLMSMPLPAMASSRSWARSSNTTFWLPEIVITIERQRSSRLAGSAMVPSSRANSAS